MPAVRRRAGPPSPIRAGESAEGARRLRGEQLELRIDLVIGRVGIPWMTRGHRCDRIRGRAQGVCSHVGDTRGLCGGPRCGDTGGSARARRGASGDESAPDLIRGAQFAAAESPGPRDRLARSRVIGRLVLEEGQCAFSAVGGPRGDRSPIELAQGLRRRSLGHDDLTASVVRLAPERRGARRRGGRERWPWFARRD